MLPYTTTAEIQDQAGATLDNDVPVRVEQAGSMTNRVGQAYDWVGEAHIDAAENLVGQINIRLIVDGRTFKLIEATEHDFLPHVELRLRESRGG